MSVDALGRVIVGSGHFIERAPQILDAAQRIVVGSGQYQFVSNAVARTQTFAQSTGDAAWQWTRHVVDDTIRETVAEAAEREAAQQAYRERVAERLGRLGEAGGDIVEAYGWAYSGDLQSAWEKLVDAAVKTGEVFVENATNPPPTR